MYKYSISDHSDVCQILNSRLGVLRGIRAEWSVSEPKVHERSICNVDIKCTCSLSHYSCSLHWRWQSTQATLLHLLTFWICSISKGIMFCTTLNLVCSCALTCRTLWTLEMSLLVLPELHSLISSRHASHVKCGCKVVKLILKSFGPVIKTNMATPPSHGGVDITKEERCLYITLYNIIVFCLILECCDVQCVWCLDMRDVWRATPTWLASGMRQQD